LRTSSRRSDRLRVITEDEIISALNRSQLRKRKMAHKPHLE
jgi:hypothetical protein